MQVRLILYCFPPKGGGGNSFDVDVLICAFFHCHFNMAGPTYTVPPAGLHKFVPEVDMHNKSLKFFTGFNGYLQMSKHL